MPSRLTRNEFTQSLQDKKIDVVPGAYEHGTQLVAASARIRREIEAFLRSH